MIKLILIPSLLLISTTFASKYDYEITPLVGYNITEGNLDIDDYAIIGGEVQLNNLNTLFKPELSGQLSRLNYQDNESKTYLLRLAINGVYEFDKINSITPIAKVGLGYSYMNNPILGNHNSLFMEAGVGAKIPFTDNLALKLESVYMLKDNNSRYDNNLAVLAGINYAFILSTTDEELKRVSDLENDTKPIEEPKTEKIVPKEIEAKSKEIKILTKVESDDDKDGVLNSIDRCKDTPSGYTIDDSGCILEVVPTINFSSSSWQLDTKNRKNLVLFTEFLRNSPSFNVEIIGHTDRTGSKRGNTILSQKRADTIQELLLNEGIQKSRIATKAMGESKPIATNKTSDGRAQNRRVETNLIKTK